MKIVLVITGLSTGGAEMMLLKVLERLNRQRFSPHVISLTTMGEIGSRIVALGIPVEAIGMKTGVPSPLGFARLIRCLRKLRPDVVHTWMYHADLLGGLAARLAGVRSVGWCIRHSNFLRIGSKRSTKIVVMICSHLSRCIPDLILCCSEVASRVHSGIGYAGEKMVVIPNGFDVSRFQPNSAARLSVRNELGLSVETPLVGMIGRYDPQKNHAGFFEAAGLLHRRLPDVHFVLAGKGIGKENRYLSDAMKTFEVGEVFHLLGQRNDINRLMAALDVLAVSSSFGEAFPNVLGEAMACGVPCAVTDVGDSAYIVGKTGCVITSGDMNGLAAAIESILTLSSDEWYSLSAKARARVVEHFEIGKVVCQYEEFYEALAALGERK
ncbi:MAG: putative glycosyltransferase EpsF [Syntrophus sp. PtaB.Bin001]|nr:MAG: putative glycosyltransferase EpsF [Syntrophus sp. PtaB.Bin001]